MFKISNVGVFYYVEVFVLKLKIWVFVDVVCF